MTTFKIDYEKVDVESIMSQIRQRVKEKTGIVYKKEDLERLGSLDLSVPEPPERKGFTPDLPDIDEPGNIEIDNEGRFFDLDLDTIQREEKRQHPDVHVHKHELLQTGPGLKGKVVRFFRKIFSKLFKLTMNIDVFLFKYNQLIDIQDDRFHYLERAQDRIEDQMMMNMHRIKDYLLSEFRVMNQGMLERTEQLNEPIQELNEQLYNLETRVNDIHKDMLTDKHDHDEDLTYLRFLVDNMKDNLRGIVEGQRLQLEYMLLRQRTLEKMVVLKEDEEEEVKKSSDLEKGRYRGGSKEGEQG